MQGGIIYEIRVESPAPQADVLKIVDLLCCSYTLISGYNLHESDRVANYIEFESEKDATLWAGIDGYYIDRDGYWPFAMLLAERIYGDQRCINAVSRYHSAHKIVDLHPMDLNPYDDPMKDNYLLSEQMEYANCIVACYAALEEVGLHVDLKKGDHLLNSEKTAWDHLTYVKTSKLLEDAGIDPSMELVWLFRGQDAYLQKKFLVKSIRNCEWNSGYVGDYYTTPVDALLKIKQLRNKAGAHNDDDSISSLSIYDVENAFYLSKTLLLVKFGLYHELIKKQ